jgi:hypothetical protein
MSVRMFVVTSLVNSKHLYGEYCCTAKNVAMGMGLFVHYTLYSPLETARWQGGRKETEQKYFVQRILKNIGLQIIKLFI